MSRCPIIEKDIANFSDQLAKARDILKDFSLLIDHRIQSVRTNLDSLTKVIGRVYDPNATIPITKVLNVEIAQWQKDIESCQQDIKKNIEGRDFQHRFEKLSLLIVFGIVKSGKSTLGNFIRGRAFLKAPFDNAYKKELAPKKPIKVEESGRKGDAKEKEWFDENSIESTCSVQYSEMPGLAWVDTPGFGAVQKKDIDIRPLAELAQEYVQYADLVIFLANSSCVGNQEDIRAYKGLYRNGKKALAIITRSDTTESDYIEDGTDAGKIIQKIIPKTKENRKQQEQYLVDELARLGVPKSECSAMSISAFLAEKAVEEQSDDKWKASNMGLLYEKIGYIIGSDQILKLKQKGPLTLLKKTFDEILEGGKSENESATTRSLQSLLNHIQKRREEMQVQYDRLAPTSKWNRDIADEVVSQMRIKIRRLVDSKSNSQNDTVSVSLAHVQNQISEIFNEELTEQVKKIIGDYQQKTKELAISHLSASMTREKIVHRYDVPVPYRVQRSPEGLGEVVKTILTLGSKRYYRTEIRTETRTIETDLGFTINNVYNDLIDDLRDSITQSVKEELHDLRDKYFKEGMNKLDHLIKEIQSIIQHITTLRTEIASDLKRVS